MEQKLLHAVNETKYPLEAFAFVQRGLDFTVQRLHGDALLIDDDEPVTAADFDLPADTPDTPDALSEDHLVARHISGEQLCWGLRDYAMQQYGLMARSVLRHWYINNCADFGYIVFAMVDAGLMYKTDEDTIDDFVGVFQFGQAFSPRLQLDEIR